MSDNRKKQDPPKPKIQDPPRRTGTNREPPVEKFPIVNSTQAAEDAFDLAKERGLQTPAGVFGTIAYIMKGALGAGILSSHCGYAASGYIAVPLTALIGIYMTYCLHILVKSAQKIYKRTAITRNMTYADVAEAALATNPRFRKWSKCFRYFIDFCVMCDLFGSCTCYQLMIAKTIKQLVENTQEVTFKGLTSSYPHFRIYLLINMVPMMLICLIRNMSLLGKISILGNMLVLMCVIAAVYYSLKANPTMEGMIFVTNFKGIFTFIGITVFSMSCSGIVVSLECNMREPHRFGIALAIGMIFVVTSIGVMSLFGYSAYGEASQAPITVHFPMTWFPKILKVAIALMLVITHAANFWVPFNLFFHYVKKLHPERQHNMLEYIYRAAICGVLTCIGIAFPSVNKLMAFLGAFCLSNMAFIYPCLIYLSVNWHRPGLGVYKWRLIKCSILIFIGLIMFGAGSFVNFKELVAMIGQDLD